MPEGQSCVAPWRRRSLAGAKGGAGSGPPPSRPCLLVCDTRDALTYARRRFHFILAVTYVRKGLSSPHFTGGAGTARSRHLPSARGSWAEWGSGPRQADSAPTRTAVSHGAATEMVPMLSTRREHIRCLEREHTERRSQASGQTTATEAKVRSTRRALRPASVSPRAAHLVEPSQRPRLCPGLGARAPCQAGARAPGCVGVALGSSRCHGPPCCGSWALPLNSTDSWGPPRGDSVWSDRGEEDADGWALPESVRRTTFVNADPTCVQKLAVTAPKSAGP